MNVRSENIVRNTIMPLKHVLLSVFASVVIAVSLIPSTAFANSVKTDVLNVNNLHASAVNAEAIVSGKSYSGSTKEGEEIFYSLSLSRDSEFRITGSANDSIKFAVYPINSSEFNSSTEIASELFSFDKVKNETTINVEWYLNSGSYYLVVSRYFYSYTNFTFKPSIKSTDVDFQERQGGTDNYMGVANNIQLGKTYTAQFSRDRYANPTGKTDIDFYKFEVPMDGQISVKADSSMKGLKATVYDSGASAIATEKTFRNDLTNNCDLHLACTLSSGTYYLAMEIGNSYGYSCTAADKESSGLYSFSVGDQFAQSAQPAQSDGSMFRLYNPNSGEHFYTANSAERDALSRIGWKYEGVGWTAPSISDTPVHRLYNPNTGDHHYTQNASERDMLVGVGWKYEGIGWYSDDAKGVPLYRQYNPNVKAGSHNYTTSKAENDWLVSIGWVGEGIGWYGCK